MIFGGHKLLKIKGIIYRRSLGEPHRRWNIQTERHAHNEREEMGPDGK